MRSWSLHLSSFLYSWYQLSQHWVLNTLWFFPLSPCCYLLARFLPLLSVISVPCPYFFFVFYIKIEINRSLWSRLLGTVPWIISFCPVISQLHISTSNWKEASEDFKHLLNVKKCFWESSFTEVGNLCWHARNTWSLFEQGQLIFFREINNKTELSSEFFFFYNTWGFCLFVCLSRFHGKNLPASTLLCLWSKLRGISSFSEI